MKVVKSINYYTYGHVPVALKSSANNLLSPILPAVDILAVYVLPYLRAVLGLIIIFDDSPNRLICRNSTPTENA